VTTAPRGFEGEGFPVRRAFAGVDLENLDPFIHLDQMGEVEYAPGEPKGTPWHPHRGFETVTYVISGSFQHKDSAGNSGELREGWVQWMTAGSGVVHSEMPGDDMVKNGGRSEVFQLWVNLPAKDKMVPPRYQDTPADKIPIATAQEGKVWVKVIAGESLGTKAVIETRSPMMYLDIHLKPGTFFEQPVPKGFDGFAYIWFGSGYLGDSREPAKFGQVGILGDGEDFRLEASADEELRVLLIAGEPLREPVAAYGPFVMNTVEEIQQAFADYQSGQLGAIQGADKRYRATEEARKKMLKAGK
jgi:redox-sensitive bicupin YhaK (pirin superfamily)